MGRFFDGAFYSLASESSFLSSLESWELVVSFLLELAPLMTPMVQLTMAKERAQTTRPMQA